MDKQLLQKAFYTNKSGDNSYNYDLTPLIQKFDFYDFLDYAHKNKIKDEDYGGFLVITPNQYIIGYNAGFGTGTHMSSFARTMKDIKGGGFINGINEAVKLTMECEDNYLTAVIIYEKYIMDMNSNPIFSGYISFDIKRKISEKEYRMFEKFYDDYNSDLAFASKRFNFDVLFNYIDEKGKERQVKSKNLDLLNAYLKNNIDYNIVNNENETIIGVPLNSKTL